MNTQLVATVVGLTGAIVLQSFGVERHVPGEYATIQAAIDASSDGDEVVIAPGTYEGDGNRDLDYGGRAITVRSTDPNDPNVVAATVIKCNPDDPNDPDDPNYYGDHRGFYFHTGEGPNSVVAGLTVISGYIVPGDLPYNGGAIHCDTSSPTIRNSVLTDNYAFSSGGAVYCKNSHAFIGNCTMTRNESVNGACVYCTASNASIVQCTVTDNSAAYGGGIACKDDSSVTIRECQIIENTATVRGGGLYSEYSSPSITNCRFAQNQCSGPSSDEGGGGILFRYCESPSVVGCEFLGNSSAGEGGGIQCYYSDIVSGAPSIANCIFLGNTAATGGGLKNLWSDSIVSNCSFVGNSASVLGGGMCNIYSRTTVRNCTFSCNSSDASGGGGGIASDHWKVDVTNCLLWGNIAGSSTVESNQIYSFSLPDRVTYSCIQGCESYCSDPNDHNTGEDPLFADPNGPDGDPNTWEDNDYHLSLDSPCRDAGDPNGDYADQTDIDAQPRVVGSNVDMGADEFARVLTLTVVGQDKGQVVVEPNDMFYEPNAIVTLTAEAHEGKGFFGWEGDVPAGQEQHNPLTITMNADKEITATFKCGLGMGPMLPMMACGLFGFLLVLRRRAA